MKFTRKELDQLWYMSCSSFLSKPPMDHMIESMLQPVNKTWKEILKKEKTGIFYLHWCKSMLDAKTLVEEFKIKYYDIIIDLRGEQEEYIIWCKKDLYQD